MSIKQRLLILLCIPWLGVQSQNYITVDHNGTPSLYSSISDAVFGAQSGDYIYIPGGTFSESFTINKELHIFGAGHYPDSTEATNLTKIQGTVTVITGADNGSLTGVFVYDYVYFGTSHADETVNNFIITRCYLSKTLYLSYDYTAGYNNSQNLYLSENVFGNKVACGIDTLIFFEKNIFNSQICYIKNGTFKNNIFLENNLPTIGNTTQCLFENNIFRNANYGVGSENSTYNNNLFNYNQTFPSGTNVGNNNISNYAGGVIFINYAGQYFSYDEDYHLDPACPGVGWGTDGTDIGIYGTGEPYKEGAVPANPHIRTKSISVQNNVITVDIEVSAQDR